jgi:hypothetical protein
MPCGTNVALNSFRLPAIGGPRYTFILQQLLQLTSRNTTSS